MQFYTEELVRILKQQQQEVTVYDEDSFARGQVSSQVAIKLAVGGRYVGIGSPRRIRAIRPLRGCYELAELRRGSQTTRRLRNTGGDLCAADWVVEHRQ